MKQERYLPAGSVAGLSDDHVHSTAGSQDARATITEMCEQAVTLGLAGLCFTEHVDFDRSFPEYGYYQYEAVRRQVEDARERFAGQLEIRMGLEVDFRPEFLPELLDVLPRCPVDFILGSVHGDRGMHFVRMHAVHPAPLPVDELAGIYRRYFADVRALIRTGLVDCVGHLDYPAKVGLAYPDEEPVPGYAEELEQTLALAAACRVGLEINTKRCRTGAPPAAPARAVRRYVELGGDLLTLGSDAHRAGDLGHGLEIGRALLRSAGVTAQTIFRRRQAMQLVLQR